jgi:hypothetical protein
MKNLIKNSLVIGLFMMILFTSCRTEEIESIQAPIEETLSVNSTVANLMRQTTMNDGSNDNIIDNSNCFNIQLPVTVVVNGTDITVSTEDGYEEIEDIFDEFDDDDDDIVITFPIVIILNDFTEITINNYTEFYSYSSNCNGENISDDDIECIDFQYPITAAIFNAQNELISSVTFTNDSQLYLFIDNIDESDFVSISFPISVVLSDGTQISINNLNDLEDTIETFFDDCDEDDDYDYNDDDCNDCNTDQLMSILTGCSDWFVDKLERYGNDYDNYYDGYLFNFFTDGTISVQNSGDTVYGTWSASGTGNNMIITINIPDLDFCNNDWLLHEIDQGSSETKVDFRVGDDDRLRYENNCN